MPPRLNLFIARRAVSALHQPTSTFASPRSITLPSRFPAAPVQRRWNSSRDVQDLPPEEEPKGPTQDQLPHVSEEAAEISRIMNKDKEKQCDGTPSTPELEQGTPVSEILQRDKKAMKHMPKVMQDQVKGPGGTRSFSTSARSRMPDVQESSDAGPDPTVDAVASMISQANEQAAALHPGLKFEPPETPANTRTMNFRRRYDSLQELFTKVLMKHGKLARAQKNMAAILDHLRTAPPPQFNQKRPLIGAPPAPQLPLDPVLYLTLIVDSVGPLFRIKSQKGVAGGGTAVPVPFPLNLHQRRRIAIRWIIDASSKRRETQLAARVANELVAVAEGRSGVWDRKDQQHKMGISARENVGVKARKMGLSK